MFCPKCGNEVPAGMNFCTNCGFRISEVSQMLKGGDAPDAAPGAQSPNAFPSPYGPASTGAPDPYDPPQKPGELYHGVSNMETFRVMSGILFLLGIVGTVLNPIITNLYYRAGATYVSTTLWMIIEQAVVSCLIPGLFSLILKKPGKAGNIILTIVFAFLLAATSAGQIISFFNHLPWLQKILNLLISIPVGPLFCFIMALISLRMPEFLVGEPKPVLSRSFKTVSGIIHLVGAGLLLIPALVLFVLFLIRGYGSFPMAMATLSITLFSLAGSVFFSGFCSIRAGKGSGTFELSSIFTHLILVFRLFGLLLSIFLPSLTSGRPTGGEIVAMVLVFLALSGILAWYIICLVIGVRTFLQARKNA